MTNEINNGGPAFPCHADILPSKDGDYAGMTLRDYFAAKVLCGYMATEYPAQGLESVGMEANDLAIAKHCYAMADAMLNARETK